MSGCDQIFNLWKASNSFTLDATAGNMNPGLVVLSE